jgi:hypothetical protein
MRQNNIRNHLKADENLKNYWLKLLISLNQQNNKSRWFRNNSHKKSKEEALIFSFARYFKLQAHFRENSLVKKFNHSNKKYMKYLFELSQVRIIITFIFQIHQTFLISNIFFKWFLDGYSQTFFWNTKLCYWIELNYLIVIS